MAATVRKAYRRPVQTKAQGEALHGLEHVRTALSEALCSSGDVVAAARREGLSEDVIADVLGIHRNTLTYRYGKRQERPGRRPAAAVPSPRPPS